MRQLKKILHIDDDPIMRMMVKKALERSDKGFEIISCTSAGEFMNQIQSFHPDLLIIDVIMPVTDGPTLLGKVRQLDDKTAAVFMTGQENPNIIGTADLEPILGIINKPFSPTMLGDDLLRLWEMKN